MTRNVGHAAAWATSRMRCHALGVAVVFLLASSSAVWPAAGPTPSGTPGISTPAPGRSGQPPAAATRTQRTLDYFEIVNKDRAAVRQYLGRMEAEIEAFRPRLEALRKQSEEFGKDNAANSRLEWLIGDFKRFDDISGLTLLRGAAKRFDDEHAALTRTLADKNYSDDTAFSLVNASEVTFQYYLNSSAIKLWQTYLWEATWDLQILLAKLSAKGSIIEASRRGAMNAIMQALRTDYDSIPCGTTTCPDPFLAAESEADRKQGGVCSEMNDELAKELPEIVAGMQAVAARLRESRSRMLDELRKVMAQIEKDKSGNKSEIYASIDRTLANTKTIPVDNNNTGFGQVDDHLVDTVPHWSPNNDINPYRTGGKIFDDLLRPCQEWPDQMPDDLAAKFPSVAVEFIKIPAAWGRINFKLVLSQAQIVEGTAQGRNADEKP